MRKYLKRDIFQVQLNSAIPENLRKTGMFTDFSAHIAAALKFRNPAYFCEIFKKHFGATPLQYKHRKQ